MMMMTDLVEVLGCWRQSSQLESFKALAEAVAEAVEVV